MKVKYPKTLIILAVTIVMVSAISILTVLNLNKAVKTNTFVDESQNIKNKTIDTDKNKAASTIGNEKEIIGFPVESNNSGTDAIAYNDGQENANEDKQAPEAELGTYGELTIDGMTTEDYNSYKGLQWTHVSTEGRPEDMEIDLTRQYSYKELEAFMMNLAKYDNVYLDIIGKTEQGRNIYGLTIDYGNNGSTKDVVLNTGQTHALEFAGGVYILKQYSELIKQAEADPGLRLKLQNVAYHAIPVVNPDGREIILNGGDVSRKSNANGVDINRNFNSINAGQKANDISQNSSVNKTPGLGNFPGYTLGSEAETQAAMKWLDTYAASAKGKVILLDYHQMGHVIYSDKPWRIISAENSTKNIQQAILSFLNNGVSANHYAYIPEGSTYGLAGVGGTLTDYFVSVADGFKIDAQSGRMMYEVNGVKMPLIQFRDIDRFTGFYKPVNPDCIAMTIEIGSGMSALGYDQAARDIMNNEYINYSFNRLLIFAADLISESKYWKY